MDGLLHRRTLVGTAVVLAILAGLQVLPNAVGTQRATDLFQLCLAAGTTAAALRASSRARGTSRIYWALVAGSTGVWAIGQLLYTREMTGLSVATASNLQRGLFLFAPWPLAAAALIRPDHPQARPALRVLDVGLMAVLVLFVHFYVSVAWSPFDPKTPVWREFATVSQLLAATVTLMPAYMAPPGDWRRTYRRVAGAAMLWFGGNAILAIPIFFLPGWYRPGLLDLPWTVPFLWLALTAWDWRAPVAAEPAAPWEPWRDSRRELVLALGAVTAIAALPLAISVASNMDDQLWRARSGLTMAALIVIVGLLAVRQQLVVDGAEARARVRARDLEQSDAMFQGAFTSSPAAMVLVRTGDASVVDINARAAELVGRPREALVGIPATEAIPTPDSPADAGLTRLLGQTASIHDQPLRLQRPGGQFVDCLASVEPVRVAGEPCALLLLEDVGQRRQLEEQLAQLQRVDAIGRLAGGIAHEFNNQLTAIITAASLAQGAVTDADAVRTYLDTWIAPANAPSS